VELDKSVNERREFNILCENLYHNEQELAGARLT